MIRTLIALTAFAALAGAANAAEMKVSLVGKDDSTIRSDIDKAAKLVCQDTGILDYAPCVAETFQNALTQISKSKSVR